MTETYLAQSPVTDPGAHASWVAELPKDVSALRNEPLRIPEELTSYSPTSGPQQVTLRPGLAT
jgi:hypothetical protein